MAPTFVEYLEYTVYGYPLTEIPPLFISFFKVVIMISLFLLHLSQLIAVSKPKHNKRTMDALNHLLKASSKSTVEKCVNLTFISMQDNDSSSCIEVLSGLLEIDLSEASDVRHLFDIKIISSLLLLYCTNVSIVT